MNALKIGVIGFGGMGKGTCTALAQSQDRDLVAIADLNPNTRRKAKEEHPTARILDDGLKIIEDPSIDAVAITTLADARPHLLRQALARNKHVWAEKPLAASIEEEEALLEEIEACDRQVAVNLFNRNAWYHETIKAFIASGEIGDLACIRVRHFTPGRLPHQGHAPEGPPFHDCGTHYVDVAR